MCVFLEVICRKLSHKLIFCSVHSWRIWTQRQTAQKKAEHFTLKDSVVHSTLLFWHQAILFENKPVSSLLTCITCLYPFYTLLTLASCVFKNWFQSTCCCTRWLRSSCIMLQLITSNIRYFKTFYTGRLLLVLVTLKFNKVTFYHFFF